MAATAMIEVKDFKPEVSPDWCPGCGDFAVLHGLFQVCADLQIRPHDLTVVSGIGCSSNLPGLSVRMAFIACTAVRCPLRRGRNWPTRR